MLEKKSFSKFVGISLLLILAGIIFIISLLAGGSIRGEVVAQVSTANTTSSLTKLERGVRNNYEVKLLQQLLADQKYYTGKIDGTFGRDTENALKKFQTAYGVKETGILGGNWEPVDEKLILQAGSQFPNDNCRFDLDNNGSVGVGDLISFLGSFGSVGNDLAADFDEDDIVTVLDLILFISAYGQSVSECPGINVSLSQDNLSEHVVQVDTSSNTNNVELLKFTVEAQESDMNINQIPVFLTTTGATDVDFVANSLRLQADGEEWFQPISTTNTTETIITFDNLDFVIEEGDEIEFTVMANINNLDSNFTEGNTLTASLRTIEVDAMSVENENGNLISIAYKNGSALGDTVAFYSVGIFVTFESSSATAYTNSESDDDIGEFEIVFKVDAFGGDVYISNIATPIISNTISEEFLTYGGNRYRLLDSGTAVIDDQTSTISYTISDGADNSPNGNIALEEGETTFVTLTISQMNNSVEDDGIYRAYLKAVAWNTTDSLNNYNVYDFDIGHFNTNPIPLN